MGRVLNLMAFVIFATTLFMRSVDPVIPQIAAGLNVTPTTAALLSTGFTLPDALVQPVLGALADMFSRTRLIAVCMLIVGIATIACGLATNFEMLMTLRVIAGIAAGGVFPIALAVAGDRVPVQQRQAAVRGYDGQSAGCLRRRRDWRRRRLAWRVLRDRSDRSCRACGGDARLSQHE